METEETKESTEHMTGCGR